MTRETTLSQEVRSFIDTLDWESDRDVPPDEREEATKARKIVKVLVDDIIASREMVTDNEFADIEERLVGTPELIESFLDERFTRDVINAVPGYVGRTMELSRLEGSRIPSKMTNGYLHEAARTYIFGLPQASIALCRAGLEQALKENLGYQGTGTIVKMEDLLDEAESAGVIDNLIRKTARQIANDADDVLHEEPADLATAYEVLLMLRGVLQHVYAE